MLEKGMKELSTLQSKSFEFLKLRFTGRKKIASINWDFDESLNLSSSAMTVAELAELACWRFPFRKLYLLRKCEEQVFYTADNV